jgi:hypothetical protein
VARIVQQKNPWAAQAGAGGGLDPQRSDLWTVDFKQVSDGLSVVLEQNVPGIPTYFAQSLNFPEPKVRGEMYRRDSRPYNMPGFDEPLDPVRMTFILESPGPGTSSRIYRFLDNWRQVVRAGRGAMSAAGASITLDENYRIDYAFNINVFLLAGTANGVEDSDLDYSATYTLINAWLGSFKLTDVAHEGTRVMGVEAQLYVEDIIDQNGDTLLR